jgi:Flp pilus assembly protein TadB
MKTLVITCLCSVALAWTASGQSPTVPPSPAGVAGAGSAASPATSVSPSPTAQSDWQQKMEKKHKKHINFTIDGNDGEDPGHVSHSGEDIPEMVVPIVAVVMLAVFGAPVLIVGLIMYFGFSRNRMMHKTIRMMVEKGQEVPAALLVAPPPAVRQRSDMRRGVVLVMVGVGLMLFFAAVNNWEGGSWAIGVIPFVIGLGYLLVWKLEGKKDNPPALP